MIFRWKKPPPLTPEQRAFAAVDELNSALSALRREDGYQSIRVYVVGYDPSTKKQSHVVLGTWNNRAFDVLYEGE